MPLAANGLDMRIGHPALGVGGPTPKRGSHASAPHDAAQLKTKAVTRISNPQCRAGDGPPPGRQPDVDLKLSATRCKRLVSNLAAASPLLFA